MIDLNKVAIIAGEHNVTYSELLKRVAQFARKTPKGKQTKTVIFSENREGWAYAFSERRHRGACGCFKHRK